MNYRKNLLGQAFGRLKAIGEGAHIVDGGTTWICLCECGTTCRVRTCNLTSGKTKSCGCTRHDSVTKHGMSETPEYHVWEGMLQRCTNPQYHQYSYYGGRGITVCLRWMQFENFFADMGRRPPNLSLERIDNNVGYEPGNCRWATKTEQQNNRRNTVNLTIDGVTKSVTQWSMETGIGTRTLEHRLKSGWHPKQAVFTKVRPHRRKHAASSCRAESMTG
jgi:hypothetical protein